MQNRFKWIENVGTNEGTTWVSVCFSEIRSGENCQSRSAAITGWSLCSFLEIFVERPFASAMFPAFPLQEKKRETGK